MEKKGLLLMFFSHLTSLNVLGLGVTRGTGVTVKHLVSRPKNAKNTHNA